PLSHSTARRDITQWIDSIQTTQVRKYPRR
ncbi:unnamed protein product, partial [Adineta steineri]